METLTEKKESGLLGSLGLDEVPPK